MRQPYTASKFLFYRYQQQVVADKLTGLRQKNPENAQDPTLRSVCAYESAIAELDTLQSVCAYGQHGE